MNAILKYPGGKWRIADWIISYFPKHKVYCEPYFGSGAVFFKKQSSFIETINDINSDIVNLFCTCRERSADISRLIELTPFSRQEFINCNQRSSDNLEQARRTLVRYWQSFGTTNSSLNSWKNTQTSNGPRNPFQWSQLPDIIINVLARLKEVQIENINALSLINRYDSEETLLYLDPPYLPELRKRNMYKNEMSRQDHNELLELLNLSKSKIILSAYDSELYNNVLKNWNIAEKPTQAQFGIIRTEKLYMNF